MTLQKLVAELVVAIRAGYDESMALSVLMDEIGVPFSLAMWAEAWDMAENEVKGVCHV